MLKSSLLIATNDFIFSLSLFFGGGGFGVRVVETEKRRGPLELRFFLK